MEEARPWIKASSTALQAVGTVLQGRTDDQIARFEAAQLDRKAKARFAEGAREAEEQRRQGRLMQSKARAAQAGGGGDPGDPGSLRTVAKIGAIGEYNALAELFQARTESDALHLAGHARRREGRAAKTSAYLKALPTAVSAGEEFYEAGKEFKRKKAAKKRLKSTLWVPEFPPT